MVLILGYRVKVNAERRLRRTLLAETPECVRSYTLPAPAADSGRAICSSQDQGEGLRPVASGDPPCSAALPQA